MRVLLSAIGTRGDIQPLVGLAARLRERGHQPRLCVPPDFCPWIAGLGFTVTPLGQPRRDLRRAGATTSDERLRELTEATLADQFATVTAAGRDCDVIVAMAQQVATATVAQTLGIEYVYASTSPVFLPSPHHAPPPVLAGPGRPRPPAAASNAGQWAWRAARFGERWGPALNRHRAALGLDPVDDVLGHVFTSRPWLAADPVLGPWPEPAGAVDGPAAVWQTGAWIWPDDRPLSPELAAFLQDGDPPVYFGFGSMRMEAGAERVIIAAARRAGRRAVIASGWAGLALAGREPGCLVIGEVNEQRLFRRVATVVHHGGAGTTTAAAAAGVPQVVVPQAVDQHYWARRVGQLGIGTAHAPGQPDQDSLTAALECALAPAVASRARSVSLAVRDDGATVAADRLVRSLR